MPILQEQQKIFQEQQKILQADVEADGADEREAALHGSQDAVQHWKVEDLILVNTMHQVIKWQLKGRFEEMQLIAHMLESQCHA